jgi:hypothetical protein
VYQGRCFILGGTDDPYFCRNGLILLIPYLDSFIDVWMTSEGEIWNKLKSSALWSPRWQHAALVHDQMIFVLGGWGDQYLNDGLVSS